MLLLAVPDKRLPEEKATIKQVRSTNRTAKLDDQPLILVCITDLLKGHTFKNVHRKNTFYALNHAKLFGYNLTSSFAGGNCSNIEYITTLIGIWIRSYVYF